MEKTITEFGEIEIEKKNSPTLKNCFNKKYRLKYSIKISKKVNSI